MAATDIEEEKSSAEEGELDIGKQVEAEGCNLTVSNGHNYHLDPEKFADPPIPEEEAASRKRNRRVYQLLLFLVTQFGYFCVTSSMLSTNFFEPSKLGCESLRRNDSLDLLLQQEDLEGEFNSLLVEWNVHCSESQLTIFVSSAVMFGAIFGSLCSGFLADRCGRKKTLSGIMLTICLGNALLAGVAQLSWIVACLLFFLLGSACGGFIVVNMVLLVEAIHDSKTRMLVVSLNGWPVGMMFTAFLGWLTKSWRMYHLVCSALAVVILTCMELFCKESVSWLMDRGRTEKARLNQESIDCGYLCNFSKPLMSDGPEERRSGPCRAFTRSPSPQPLLKASKSLENIKSYSYLDLFRHKSICVPLFVLTFCFFSSSVVSFGLIFSAEALPGNRYLNLGGMGAGKLLLGLLPYLVSHWLGRRPIILISVGAACISSSTLIAIWLMYGAGHWMIAVLGLMLVASIDPIWKINHLYSIELFPTPIRNMARGLCAVMARVGSLAGPFVIFLRGIDQLSPFYMFSSLLLVQWVVAFFLLPETKDRDLPQRMPSKKKKWRSKERASLKQIPDQQSFEKEEDESQLKVIVA